MVSRRDFFTLGAAAAAAAVFAGKPALASHAKPWFPGDRLPTHGGKDYSYLSGVKRKPVPTACAQCVSRCAEIGYLEEGRIVKLEGHPKSIRTLGRVCARGQAGLDQVYDPDRLLYPLKRAGKRGEGKWTRVTWDDALGELTARLKSLRDGGRPEKFMFHHGWVSASAEKLINEVFLATYGTATIANQTCLGQGARLSAHELTWGGRNDNWDFDNTKYVLGFGSNVIEADINHTALSRRLALSLSDRHIRLVTFDVRLSNTAAKSHDWIPIKPGTDLAVVLALCNVVMKEGYFRGEGEEFLKYCRVTKHYNATLEEKVEALNKHLAEYTPEWAEKISGVPAEKIRRVAYEVATIKPACLISSRGAGAHYNGVETERAIQMLAAITGNIDNPGGRCLGISAKWNYPTGPGVKPKARKLDVLDGFEGDAALPSSGVGQRVLRLIKDGKAGRPEIYMWYNYNPVYANGDVQENIDVLKDESLIPFTVAVTPFYDESASLADLILPDATYLERFEFEDTISPIQVPEYYIRQPLIKPLGEARDFQDVCCDLAERMGFPLGFKSAEEFVAEACKRTRIIRRKARGFRGMKRRGVWHDKRAKPIYYSYKKDAAPEVARLTTELQELENAGVLLDEETGVYWNWGKSKAKTAEEAVEKGYSRTEGAQNGYIAQKIGDEIVAGFAPGRLNKTGYFEIYSSILEEMGFPPLPSYAAIPEHESMAPDELIMTTFKVNVQTLSRTQNCKWLTEIYYENPAWINPLTAKERGIGDGDRIRIASSRGEVEAIARVTHTITPGVIAVSTHAGRWEYGRYASGKRAPGGVDDIPHDGLKWWVSNGTHPNWIIPNSPEPISGQQRWMDTVVTVSKVGASV